MGTTVNKRNRRRVEEKSSSPFISPQRKREILGLILMTLSLLITLAILTYSPADDLLARRFSWDALIAPGRESATNWLGLTGAVIARLLVPGFLGYCVLLLPFSVFGWGYVWLRNRSPRYLRLVTVLMSIAALFSASVFGWFSIVLETDLIVWSGLWGVGLAGWMAQILGTPGSVILLALALMITTLLLLDHDIQRSMDRVEAGVTALRDRWDNWWAGRKARREARKEKKARLVDAKRTEQRHAEREKKIDSEKESTSPPPENRESPTVSPHPVDSRPVESTVETISDVHMEVHEQIQEEKTGKLHREHDGPRVTYPFKMPELNLLDESGDTEHQIDFEELEEHKQILLDKLATYNIEITSIDAIVGPTVTLYELTPAPGIKISRITALENDLAMAMAARGIRMIAPIPGKSAIGVEIPNRHREFVRIRDIIGTTRFSESHMELPLILGKSIEGEVILQDLTKMPHVLIAGATGSGKSVGLNTFITGLLYACPPPMLKFVMIDPKKIELAAYADISSHYIAMPPEADEAIITDVDQALATLRSCEKEMEQRYDLFSRSHVRSLKEYNDQVKAGRLTAEDGHGIVPYIVVIVDELADLMMTAGKDIEAPIARLAQMARAVGIHLILATQRPSVDVITGLIKANFPSRIAYQVASKIDSRTILDQNGAEGLVGNGDMLYMLGTHITRLQGPFVSIKEVDQLTGFIAEQPGEGPYMLPSLEQLTKSPVLEDRASRERDELFNEAAHIIVRAQQGSVSLLQRKLSVGYARAARLIDQMEDAGIVGPFEGSKARQVLVDDEMQLDQHLTSL